MQKRNLWINLAIIALLISISKIGLGLEGQLRVVGSVYNSYMTIKEAGKDKGEKLCRGGITKKLKSLVNLTVSVKGKKVEEKGKTCYQVDSFKVVKMPSGRIPMIGFIEKVSGGYIFKNEAGKDVKIDKLHPSLKSHVGKKMILEGMIQTAEKGEKKLKIISFLTYP